jgi:peptidoglycan/LPS O-acetylase OafA/YrhL
MNPGLSLYLDLLRLMAAVQVVIYHLGKLDAADLGQGAFNAFGHEAVVIFFVLSGYVISHAAHTSERTFARYASGRISRIYSVVVPCLILTVVFDGIGLRMAPGIYEIVNTSGNTEAPFARLFICLMMLNESWRSVQFFSNAPLWSLSYEFWYYALFGFYFYFSGKKRVALILMAVLISGPRILLMLPIWLMGVAAYAVPVRATRRRNAVWIALAWIALLQPILLGVAYLHFDLRDLALQPAIWLHASTGYSLGWSMLVVSDSIIGLSFALHLAATKQFDQTLWAVLNRFGPAIRWGAGRSFTLYLLHQPLLLLLTALMLQVPDGPWRPAVILAGTLALPMLMSPMIEVQRHRLRPLVERLQNHLWPDASVLGPKVLIDSR